MEVNWMWGWNKITNKYLYILNQEIQITWNKRIEIKETTRTTNDYIVNKIQRNFVFSSIFVYRSLLEYLLFFRVFYFDDMNSSKVYTRTWINAWVNSTSILNKLSVGFQNQVRFHWFKWKKIINIQIESNSKYICFFVLVKSSEIDREWKRESFHREIKRFVYYILRSRFPSPQFIYISNARNVILSCV